MFDFLIDVVPREEPAPAASVAQPSPVQQQLTQHQQAQLLGPTSNMGTFDHAQVTHEPMFGAGHVGQQEDEALYRDFILDGEGA